MIRTAITIALALIALFGTTLSAQTLCPPTPGATEDFWISSSNTNEIYRFASDGTPLGSFSMPGLSHPRGITAHPNGQMWISSQFTSEIFVCDRNGNFSHTFTIPGLSGPTGAAIDNAGNYYVCSFTGDSVLVVDSNEQLIQTITSPGLNGPNCIVFRPDGGFYVTGQLSNDVHSFDAAGNPLGSFPTGQISVMGGMLDTAGRLLVAGGSSNDVRRFDCDGNVIDTWAISGGPQSLALRQDGTIFVTTFFTNEVRWYTEDGVLIDNWTGGLQIRGLEFLSPLGPATFIRGDANRDGSVEIADAITVLNALFASRGPLPCEDAADSNDDGALNIADPVSLLAYLFSGGPPPPEPTMTPGVDPTSDGLNCVF